MSGVGVRVGAGVSVMVGGAVGKGTVGVIVGVSSGGGAVGGVADGRQPETSRAELAQAAAIQRWLFVDPWQPDLASRSRIGECNVTVPWMELPCVGGGLWPEDSTQGGNFQSEKSVKSTVSPAV